MLPTIDPFFLFIEALTPKRRQTTCSFVGRNWEERNPLPSLKKHKVQNFSILN